MAIARTKAMEIDHAQAWSPAENPGMRRYDLNTGGVRIVIFPSMFRIGLFDDI